MDPFDQFKQTFFEESDELLLDASSRATGLDPDDYDVEELHALFRAVHSIKAGAGAFKFMALAEFTHKFETLLDKLRDGEVALDQTLVDLIVRGVDIVSDYMDAAKNDVEADASVGADALGEMEAFLGGGDAPAPAAADASTVHVDAETGADEASGSKTYRVLFHPGRQLFQFANEPLLFVRELQTFGDLSVEVDVSALPELEKIEQEDSYFAWTFTLVTDRSAADIEEVFEFVVDDAKIEIEEVGSAPAAGETPEAPVVETSAPVSVAKEAAARENGEKEGEDGQPRKSSVSSIRVDLDRIDRLVNMVGELVIAQAMMSQQARENSGADGSRHDAIDDELAVHTRELQDAVMAIRMQPVKSVFMRMPRMVRDLSRKLEKNVNLVMRGEQTEVDKTIIEELADPLTHMIRNSLDHGIEKPADRKAAGKPAQAEIVLSAEHRSGKIVIQVTDDGRGIDRERVLSKAIENGLVSADANLSDEEIDNLIFAPGFSTAAEVTDVSGRGVGMDVVRRNIQNLGGRVMVSSRPGEGTRFVLTLPLTLAVLDGMVVAVGDQQYIVPLTSIVETVRPARKDIRRIDDNFDTFAMRGEYLRLVYLGRIFNVPRAIQDPSKGLVVIVDTETAGRVGVVVDELLGQQQVVIKGIDTNYQNVEGISGATILGSGKVSLILDLDGLAEMRSLPAAREEPPTESGPDDGGAFRADGKDEVGAEPELVAAPATSDGAFDEDLAEDIDADGPGAAAIPHSRQEIPTMGAEV